MASKILLQPRSIRKIPQRVSAAESAPADFVTLANTRHHAELFNLSRYVARGAGECLHPVIRDGDWMVCDRTRVDKVRSGSFVIVSVPGLRLRVNSASPRSTWDNEVMTKQLRIDPDGRKRLFMLDPEPREIPIDDPSKITIVAVVQYVTKSWTYALKLSRSEGGMTIGEDGIPELDIDSIHYSPDSHMNTAFRELRRKGAKFGGTYDEVGHERYMKALERYRLVLDEMELKRFPDAVIERPTSDYDRVARLARGRGPVFAGGKR
jgi:hypothetical protein